MKTLLVALNAKYIHSNFAVRYLRYYAQNKRDYNIETLELTINQSFEMVLKKIFEQKPDLLCFSCYIWNIEFVKRLAQEYKKINKDVIIALGGPEVSYNCDEVFANIPATDIIMRGEGEEVFVNLLDAFNQKTSYDFIKGISFKKDGQLVENPIADPINMDNLPFAYPDIKMLKHQIVYYESSRGCPFNCQYCLSSVEKGVRFKSLPLVFNELKLFLEANVSQVKFVDRTFNCNKTRTAEILEFLIKHDNGITNFHFEISADLLDDTLFEILKGARKGLFQFEIGVQSINPDTLKAIRRTTDLEVLKNNVLKVLSFENIHQHLDLIAGLPYENYQSFRESFNFVYALKPAQLQLGFLKLLKGSGMYIDREKYGLVAQDTPPYEVLFTDVLSFEEKLKLKSIEEMVELYFNSFRFSKTVNYLVTFFNTPFDFFEALADYYDQHHLLDSPHSKNDYYDMIYQFAITNVSCDINLLKWIIKFDLCMHEKPKNPPACAEESFVSSYIKEIRAFYSSDNNIQKYLKEYSEYDASQINRMAHIEIFPYDIFDHYVESKTVVLFNYKDRDINKNAAFYKINL